MKSLCKIQSYELKNRQVLQIPADRGKSFSLVSEKN